MSNNNSKTNRNARRKIVLERFNEYVRTGVYVVPDRAGFKIAIPKDAMQRIEAEREILKQRIY